MDPIGEARRQWVAHGWPDAAPGMAAVTTIFRVQQLLAARIDTALRPYNLSFARFEVLRLLSFAKRGELPMGKLGERLQVHPASVTSAVTRLEAAGYVQRIPHPANNRSTLAKIQPAGRRLLNPATRDLNTVFESLGLAPQQLDRLVELLAPLCSSSDNLIRAAVSPG
jgi:DNA-binding MarR family transcriptional regulator